MRRLLSLCVLAAGLSCSSGESSPQQSSANASPEPLERLMQLNRTGRWAEAARMSDSVLSVGGLSAVETCEVRASRAYALAHSGRVEEARSEAAGILADCADVLQQGYWVLREAERLLPRAGPPAVREDDGWSTAEPSALGIDRSAVAEHQQLCEDSGADACLIAVEGQVIQEWYGPGYHVPMHTMSSMKSWAALLAGILIEEGRLGLDDPVSRWIPEWRSGAEAGVTVRHLLTMTSGLPSSPELSPRSVGRVADKNAFTFGLELTSPPGVRWAYSNEGAHLLSPILERAAGQPLEEFAQARLFRPMKMLDTKLMVDGLGTAWTHADATTTLRDFAKICQLALGRGAWGGERIVSEEWMRRVATPIPQNAGYGMLWWVEGDPRVVMTKGFRNTDCYAFLDEGVVVARMQNAANPARVPYTLHSLQRVVARLVGR